MTPKELLYKFAGESERNAELTAQSTAILAALDLKPEAIAGKTADEIASLVKAKIQPAAAASDSAALLAAQTEIKNHVAAHATLSSSHLALCSSLGLKPESVAGKSGDEVKSEIGKIVATKSTETLARLGFSADQLKDLPDPVSAGGQASTNTDKPGLKGSERYRAAFNEQVRGDKVTFARIHARAGRN